jgi:hypothetical protein
MKLLVSVHCYQGDADQVDILWPAHIQHGAPVAILSPQDSPVFHHNAWCRTAGKRCYIGPDSLDRQWLQLKALQEFEADWYLANDADSCLLSPGLPKYIFSRPDVLWSNKVPDDIHVRPSHYPLPRFALQPPYVFSRSVLDKLLSKGQFPIHDQNLYGKYGDTKWTQTPYIDWYMMALAHFTDVPTERFLDGASCPTTESDVAASVRGERKLGPHHLGYGQMRNLVRNKGVRFVHSIKVRDVFDDICKDRTAYVAEHP